VNHMMIDIETLGTAPGFAILSIGAVVFDPITGQIGRRFYVNINPDNCGLAIDADTMAWWAKQPDEAQAALSIEPRLELRMALMLLGGFVEQEGADRIWCQGPSFDLVLLEAAYRTKGLKAPWKYNAGRDTRTLYELAGIQPDKDRPTLHNALADAEAQVLDVMRGYTILGIPKTKQDPEQGVAP